MEHQLHQTQGSLPRSLSLNLCSTSGIETGVEALSPINYRFLLRRQSLAMEEQVEEAILAIGSATCAVSFCDTVLDGIHACLSNVQHALVFLLELENNELGFYKSNTESYPLPKSGVLWSAVRRRSDDIIKAPASIAEDDPLRTLLPDFKSLGKDGAVLINPIVEKKKHKVIALIMAVCDEPSLAQVEKVRWLERNVLVAASRVIKHMVAEKDRVRAEMMLQVCGDLIDLDSTSLAIKILKHIKSTLNVKNCGLFLIDPTTHDLVCPMQPLWISILPLPALITFFLSLCTHKALNNMPLDKEVRVEVTSESIYGRCFLTGESLLLDNVSQDVRFNPTTDLLNDYEPSSMICMPIKPRREGISPQVVGVAVVCDKTNGKPFAYQDKENLEFVLRFCSSVIANTLAFQREMTLKKQNQALLQVAKNLFSRLSNLNTLFREIMNEARRITKAERCSLFLLDNTQKELVAVIFDSDLPSEEADTIHIKVGQGIAGLVAETGKFVNIRDAYKHPQFFKDMDKNTGFHTRNLLCFPIKDHNNEVVGVAQLCNKIGGNFFTTYDEELATTFSMYCGISLYQSKLYHKMTESQGRSNLATELMIYHMQVGTDDVEKIRIPPIPLCKSFNPNFTSFSFSPRSLPESDTVMAVISMMSEMNLIKRWKINLDTLARFLLMVKKGYRDTPYHNWLHALSVAHFSYTLYCQCDGLPFLSDLDIIALFISCLCHDIDHRGTNNAFQVSSHSTLASLYSSEGSVMERHHFAQTVCILNSEGSNIFENTSHTIYKQVLDQIQQNILSTDIANHLRSVKSIQEMAEVGYQPSNNEHQTHIKSLLMTSCDLSSTCKEFKWSRQIANLIYSEFFSQGDREKVLGHTPIAMMDRTKAFIPEQQLDFIDGIAGPAYKILAEVLPKTSTAYQSLIRNRKEWEKLAKERKQIH